MNILKGYLPGWILWESVKGVVDPCAAWVRAWYLAAQPRAVLPLAGPVCGAPGEVRQWLMVWFTALDFRYFFST